VYHLTSEERSGLAIGDTAKRLGKLWHNPAAGDKQPHEQKDKHRKDTAAS
jgi:hypothetical protein